MSSANQWAYGPYNESTIASAMFRGVGKYSETQKNAAARAIMRHNRASLMPELRTCGGLEKSYVDLHGQGKLDKQDPATVEKTLSDTFQDLVDVASTLDRVDGGMTVVLRVPGRLPSGGLSLEQLAVKVYAPIREMEDGGPEFSDKVARLVQFFAEHLARPHVRAYHKRCKLEFVEAVQVDNSEVQQMRVQKNLLLPPYRDGHITVRPCSAPVFEKFSEIHSDSSHAALTLTKETRLGFVGILVQMLRYFDNILRTLHVVAFIVAVWLYLIWVY